MSAPYVNRMQAGSLLASHLMHYAGRTDLLVLGLPHGGVVVAYEVAEALDCPLDIMAVRKLGLPGQKELAIGAVGSGNTRVLNEDIIRQFRVPDAAVTAVTQRARAELDRDEREIRGDRPPPDFHNRCLILVDDGLATGASMSAAIAAARQHEPARIVVAVPVAPPQTVAMLAGEVDEVVCPLTPPLFGSVGQWYVDFTAVSLPEVRALLEKAWHRQHV